MNKDRIEAHAQLTRLMNEIEPVLKRALEHESASFCLTLVVNSDDGTEVAVCSDVPKKTMGSILKTAIANGLFGEADS